MCGASGPSNPRSDFTGSYALSQAYQLMEWLAPTRRALPDPTI
jgi:hypothetical protein